MINKNSFKKITGKKLKNIDFPLLISIILLLCIGIVIMASASSYYSLNQYGNSNYLLIRQLGFAIIGVIAMIILSNVNYKLYKKWGYVIFGIGILLMLAVLIPGLSGSSKGATRWINLGFTTFQPSELMKVALTIGMATYFSRNYKDIKDIKGYIIPFTMIGLIIVIMVLQNHLSGTIIMIVAAASIIFSSGIKIKFRYIIPIVLVLVSVIFLYFFKSSDGESATFRVKRILSFLNPEEDIADGNWQATQSLYAIGSGGLFGRGLGQSRQKYLWLPEGQNDFIFSILGEELGFLGTFSVVSIFIFFIYRGYLIAMKCNTMFGSLVATGITSVFALQIIINIAVVTSVFPVTGMPLPFFSYGGTALLINLCAVGILLNISKDIK